MEDQDPPIDAHLRGKALQQAISMYAVFMQHANFDPNGVPHSDHVVDIANKFYQFLKGDNK